MYSIQPITLNDFDALRLPHDRPWYFWTDYIDTFIQPAEAIWLLICQGDQPVGALLLCRFEGEWSSLPKAPFGGFWFWNKEIVLQTEVFTKVLADTLKKMNIKQIKVKSAPEYYSTCPVELYHQEGWHCELKLNNYALRLSSLNHQLNATARRKLRGLEKKGFMLKSWFPQSAELLEFIIKARHRENQKVLVDEALLDKIVQNKHNRYLTEGVWLEDQLAAIGLTVKVNSKVWYHYQPADSALFRSFSPILLCNFGLAQKALAQGAEWLDLGLASVDGAELEGLARFKKSMGAIEMEQNIYTFRPS